MKSFLAEARRKQKQEAVETFSQRAGDFFVGRFGFLPS